MASCDSERRNQRKRRRPQLSLKHSKNSDEKNNTTEAPIEDPVPPLPSLPSVFQKWRKDKNKDIKGFEGDSDERASPPPPFSALNNVGNTCYINSVLQILRYCPRFVEALKNVSREIVECEQMADHPSGVNSALPSFPQQKQLATKLCELYKEMEEMETAFRNDPESHRSPYLSTRPIDVIHAIRENNPLFTAYAQHDAQELLRSLLSYLQEMCDQQKKQMSTECNGEMNETDAGCVEELQAMAMEPSESQAEKVIDCSSMGPLRGCVTKQLAAHAACCDNRNTDRDFDFVVGLFQGSLVFTTKCLECESRRERSEKFLDVSVPVKRFKSTPETPSKRTAVGRNSLNWSLKQFTKPERLTGENKYYCDMCNRHTEAEISTQFDSLPPILTVHLKRFTALAGGGQSLGYVTKLSGNLATPMQLRLCQWCSFDCEHRNQTYELFGVIMHNGCSTGSGHYLTYVRASAEVEKWIVQVGQSNEAKPNLEQRVSTESVEDDKLKVDVDISPISGGNSIDSARTSSTSLSEVSDMEVELPFDASLWKWLKLDDCEVEIISHADFLRAISPSSLMTSTPYILFYQM